MCIMHNTEIVIVSDLMRNPISLAPAYPLAPDSQAAVISSCAQSELIDPGPYLSPGELLMTHGMGLHFQDRRTWDAYVERLQKASVSALAFSCGTPHDTVPKGLVTACRERNLALFAVASDYPLVKLSRHVWQELEAERFATARAGWELANTCAEAAARGAHLGDLLGHIAEHIHGTVRLVDSTGFSLAQASAPATDGGRQRSTLALPGAGPERFQLVIEQPSTNMLLQPLIGPACAVLAMQLSYTLTARHPLHSHTAGSLFEALLSLTPPASEDVAHLAVSAGFQPEAPWTVVTIARGPRAAHSTLRHALLRLRVLLESHFSQVRFFDELQHGTLLAQQPSSDVDLARLLTHAMRDTPQLAVGHLDSLALDEISLVLHAARSRHPGCGVYELKPARVEAFVTETNHAQARLLAQRRLAPLERQDKVLLDTLETYLRCSGNAQRATAELFIHRNTLTHRLRRIEELLGADLTDGDERMSLLLAIRTLHPRTRQ